MAFVLALFEIRRLSPEKELDEKREKHLIARLHKAKRGMWISVLGFVATLLVLAGIYFGSLLLAVICLALLIVNGFIASYVFDEMFTFV